MKETLQYLFDGNNLSRQQAREVLLEVGKGMHSEAEFASLLTVFKMRPIESQELGGFREAMFELSTQIDLSEFQGIDVVGTGGDGKNTFNISTATCFVLAGAGLHVTKHGNYASSSTSGSSNVLEYLGYKFSNDVDKLKSDLRKGGFCFLHAPLFHPAMKHIAPVRTALKIPTFFNILGPMINPSSPRYQLIGVNNQSNLNLYKDVYQHMDCKYAIVHSIDGYDEVSLTTDILVARNGIDVVLSPADFGMTGIEGEKIYGGASVAEAAAIFIDVLKGDGTAEQMKVVVANAALAFQLVYPDKKLEECVDMALESIESGKAFSKLKALTNN